MRLRVPSVDPQGWADPLTDLSAAPTNRASNSNCQNGIEVVWTISLGRGVHIPPKEGNVACAFISSTPAKSLSALP